MENSDLTKEDKAFHKGMVHFVLSHSYMVYLGAIILGVIFDMAFPSISFKGILYENIGLVFLIAGSALVYWAQHTSRCTSQRMKRENIQRQFASGPYKYSRNPTHIGLSLTTFGLGLMVGSIFIVGFMLCAFLVTKIFFLKKEERLLEQKYGKIYFEYKSKVRTWL